MMLIMLQDCKLEKLAKLSQLDSLSIIISAVCHDFAHDGFNNAYHVNSISERAVRYNDLAVQENYHAAESFSLLKLEKYNFLSQFSSDEFKAFRKRMLGMILATDMARHVSDLSSFKSLIEQKGIKDGQNAEKLIDYTNASTEFET